MNAYMCVLQVQAWDISILVNWQKHPILMLSIPGSMLGWKVMYRHGFLWPDTPKLRQIDRKFPKPFREPSKSIDIQ